MPLPPVIVEIQAEQATPDLVDTLLGACSRAVSDGSCVLAGSQTDTDQPGAVAIVTWIAPHSVRIQVGFREGRRWREQQMSFSQADEEAEMWKAVGFSTGTLVAIESRAKAAARPPVAEVPPKPPAPPPRKRAVALRRPAARPTPRPPAPPKRSAWTALDWAVMTGNGLSYREGSSRWRQGALIRGTHFRPGGWLVVGTVAEAMGAANAARGLACWWSTLGLGVGYAVRWRTVGLELRLEAIAERLTLTAVKDATFETGTSWIGGARLGADLSWMATPLVGLIAGASLRGTGRETEIVLGPESVGSAPRWVVGLSAGVRFELR